MIGKDGRQTVMVNSNQISQPASVYTIWIQYLKQFGKFVQKRYAIPAKEYYNRGLKNPYLFAEDPCLGRMKLPSLRSG